MHCTSISLICILLCTYSPISAFVIDNRVPIISILTQPATSFEKIIPEASDKYSEIVTSYVEWVEQTGSIAALVPWELPWNLLKSQLSKTQGLVLPGGGAELVEFHGINPRKITKYQNRLAQIINWVKKENDKGNFFPVWGTCLGMQEAFQALRNNDPSLLDNKMADIHKMHSVQLRKKYWKSVLFSDLKMKKYVQENKYKQKIFYYFHHNGLSKEGFNKNGFSKEFNLLGTSKTDEGQEFVAIMEHKKYPVYMVQFHPEKNQFEKRTYNNSIDREYDTQRLMSSYIFRFVALIMKNSDVIYTLDTIPKDLRKYQSFHRRSRFSPVNSFERIYLLKNKFHPNKEMIHDYKMIGMFKKLKKELLMDNPEIFEQ